ncbi:2-cysteine adaptor domain-containing protein [European chub iridovirus]|nr:2-cysteine adaptor domain-containing protein [European chub iridovirus]
MFCMRLKRMTSPKSKCVSLRSSGYTRNPLTGNTVSTENEQMKTAKRVCGNTRLCNDYSRDPMRNPWTKRPMTRDSRMHNIMKYICEDDRQPRSSHVSPVHSRSRSDRNKLQRHWESFKDAEHPGLVGVPDDRTEVCTKWRRDRTHNPLFPNKALGKQAVFQNVLWKYCANQNSRQSLCKRFDRNPNINPISERRISPHGAIAKGLRSKCAGIRAHATYNDSSSWRNAMPQGARGPPVEGGRRTWRDQPDLPPPSFVRARAPLVESYNEPIYENVNRNLTFDDTDATGLSMLRRNMDETDMQYNHSADLFPTE